MARACVCAVTVKMTALVMDSVTSGCLKYGLKGVSTLMRCMSQMASHDACACGVRA